MDAVSFDNLAAVAAVAFAAPLLLGLVPALRVPSVLLEIGAGILLGPSVLDWVQADAAVNVLSLIGVGFLLLLAGLEIEVDRLRGAVLRLALTGFAVSFAIAVAVGYGLDAAGIVGAPFLVAVILSATSLAVVLPLLKDAGLAASAFGQMVIAAASIADVATVILLSLFFSEETAGVGVRLVLFGLFGLLCVAAGIAIAAGARVPSVSAALLRLQDTTAQIRVRGAFVLLMAFSIIAQRFGLEAILGTFLAGMLLKLADRDDAMTHSHFHQKLTEAGFGFFIPVFFVASGLRLDAGALVSDSSTLLHVPVLVAAIYVIRGLPAVLYAGLLGKRRAVAAGLLQSTTLSFVLIASQIGQELGLLGSSDAAALTAAALVSVLVNPVLALAVLGARGVTGNVAGVDGERKPSDARTQGASILGVLARPRTPQRDGLQPPEPGERCRSPH